MSIIISFLILLLVLFLSEKFAKPYNIYIDTAAVIIFLVILILRLWWLFVIIGLTIYILAYFSRHQRPSSTDYDETFNSGQAPKDVTPKDEDDSDK
ncbi:hypothetical protein [Oenococcus kitaharae]|uniref:Uncharacterized protein n=1 Tax=Oenococcus kitaharae DSM 17330 TaxID=1045004 RepID=G9WH83_9LACO|nr:hypothetical protein [Oenococcus kitaharae]EHN59649.1 hypothetical protein OKIT_1571 [Oenococcus kitaharae DSM 17330]OEY83492.1 hypothetical protein NT95_05060 [Oenococcus kitaharae]OEY85291.1 hypothetical protein NT96_01505 [Oenococcus kitaharae]OEY86145.1 hypothetical protein NV75_01455 [Oenococcus kitaharae]